MSLALAIEGPAVDIVDLDGVVVKTDIEPMVIRQEGCNLNPLSRVLDQVIFVILDAGDRLLTLVLR